VSGQESGSRDRDGEPVQLVSLNPDYPPFAAGEDDTIVADWLENVERVS
jgi:hypothetical protein